MKSLIAEAGVLKVLVRALASSYKEDGPQSLW